MMNDKHKPAFGDAVKTFLEERKLTYRQAGNRLNLDSTTVWNMAQGKVPRPDTVVTFARGFGLPVSEWLTLAGYEGFEAEPVEVSGSDVLLAGIDALQREMGRPLRISFHGQIRAGLSVEEAEQTLAVIRQQAKDGLFDE